MIDNFYRSFEDRYRGSRELITERLKAYLPFIQPFLNLGDKPASLDLGCGRGEWLELLSGIGFDARGVDLDEGMLEGCRARGLNAEKVDALVALQSTPDESQDIVSAFHVVEHIDFSALQTLVHEALRVLKPGGLLILETPNPENVVVAGCKFYMDPSHRNPIPPPLLEFVAEYTGFTRVKKLRLQESEALRKTDTKIHLLDVLEGVSPDYAIVAQKSCSDALSQIFDLAFATPYGLDLAALADRFEDRLSQREQSLAEQIRGVGSELPELREQLRQLQEQMLLAQVQAQQTQGQLEQTQVQLQQIQIESHQALAQLHAVYACTSWRVTAPLRWISIQIHRLHEQGLRARIKAGVKRLALPIIRRLIPVVTGSPRLSGAARFVLNRTPWLKARILGAVSGQEVIAKKAKQNQQPIDVSKLTSHAQQIYANLRVMAQNNKQEDR